MTIVQKTISDDDIILDHDDDIPADDEPTGRVHRTHGFCEEVDSRSVKALASIFFSNKVAVLSRQDTHRTPPGGN